MYESKRYNSKWDNITSFRQRVINIFEELDCSGYKRLVIFSEQKKKRFKMIFTNVWYRITTFLLFFFYLTPILGWSVVWRRASLFRLIVSLDWRKRASERWKSSLSDDGKEGRVGENRRFVVGEGKGGVPAWIGLLSCVGPIVRCRSSGLIVWELWTFGRSARMVAEVVGCRWRDVCMFRCRVLEVGCSVR